MPAEKFHIILFILLLFGMSTSSFGQEKKLTLNHEDASMRTVLNDIEKQSGFIFSYSSRLFEDEERISVQVKDASLEAAIQMVFRTKKIRFAILEQQIVLKKDRRKKLEEPELPEVELQALSKYTISGYARNVASSEILIGATVAVPDGSAGAITNNYGFFSLTLDEKVDSLECTYVGYGKQSKGIQNRDEIITFQLMEQLQSLSEVVVYSDETRDEIRTTRSSEQRIRSEAVRKMPALFGEKDVIKSLAAIPGIKFYGDGSTIFYVRGGSRDQNMVTIDEAPVYNPTHLMGFFSTIVPDAIKDIKVYKGDFPANYGGRLSSLVDIRTKDGNMQEFGMDASLGLLSSRLSLEGPIWKDHISYFISGRRSYILKPLQLISNDLQDLHFADLHFKLNYRVNEKNRIFFSLYNSVDNFEATQGASNIAGINWKNSTATLRWNHLFSEKLFSNTTLYASSYDYYLNTNLTNGDYWNSHIENFSLKSDFTWYISPSNTLRFGAKVAQHFMNPGNFYVNHQILPLPFKISTKSANENCLYISEQVLISENFSLRIGLRFTAWNSIGPAVEYSISDGQFLSTDHSPGELYNTYAAADPRIGIVYKTQSQDILKFSFSRTSQFEHLITNSISPFSTLEVWLPSGPNIKPQKANQLTLGYSHSFGNSGLKAESEVYYKGMKNQIDYRDHAKLLMNPFIDAQLLFGEGKAYGIETLLSKKHGALNGWISYTFSRSIYTIEGINNGNPYPSYGDRPHDISLFLSYKINPRLELSGNFIYMTGSPFTSPTAFYYHENIQVPIYFKRNNDRLPDYHRMDVALNWNLRKKEGKFKHEMIFSIYNLYGRKNPVAIHFNKIENDAGQLVTPYNYYSTPELTPTQFYIYQVIPSISYHFSF
ncbi:MAG: carboxypeptidase-like regulatory domain-containing protein [Bacteroidales bacterium]|jgi:hypothetical protein|nr:carboxypeptidase-like regulatory domain-containing protein [Bacteroidales bacterium]